MEDVLYDGVKHIDQIAKGSYFKYKNLIKEVLRKPNTLLSLRHYLDEFYPGKIS